MALSISIGPEGCRRSIRPLLSGFLRHLCRLFPPSGGFLRPSGRCWLHPIFIWRHLCLLRLPQGNFSKLKVKKNNEKNLNLGTETLTQALYWHQGHLFKKSQNRHNKKTINMIINYCDITYLHNISNIKSFFAQVSYLDCTHKSAPSTNISIFLLYIYYHTSITHVIDSIQQKKFAPDTRVVEHLFMLLHTSHIMSNYIRVSEISLKQRSCETLSMPKLFHPLSSIFLSSYHPWEDHNRKHKTVTTYSQIFLSSIQPLDKIRFKAINCAIVHTVHFISLEEQYKSYRNCVFTLTHTNGPYLPLSNKGYQNFIRVSNIWLKQRKWETLNALSITNLIRVVSSFLTRSLLSLFIEALFFTYHSVYR